MFESFEKLKCDIRQKTLQAVNTWEHNNDKLIEVDILCKWVIFALVQKKSIIVSIRESWRP